MIFGFIIPALVEELSLLEGCINNLHTICDSIPDIQPVFAVILQGRLDTAPEWLLGDPSVDLQILPNRGVSNARNQGLMRLENTTDFLMFVDVSVRPGSDFIRGALQALRTELVVSAPVSFDDHISTSPSVRNVTVRQISAVRVVFRAFIWSTAFRTTAITGLRFDPSIGPGTSSPHQSGEDGRFLYLVKMRHHLKNVSWLNNISVVRPSRPDLQNKITRYAHGQGVLLGQQLRAPGWSILDRLYLLMRVFLFIANSFKFFLKGPSSRKVSLVRLNALLIGLGVRPADGGPQLM
ncbi:hypothetical protein [Niveispirillum sp. BGYR6]|uniref:hypothetical protein n=1 Tax=Niveispirillum sp. BGYR6 TaxID=2971249 RepID=UPI0022B9964C|nr:hypothetical protein [Niveispirillum sp. BGYR6]MDG5496504.1 hypothetical protein [Niveispirillum sp. BGYR6]